MLQNQDAGKLFDATTFNILTMILGAVLGGVIAPICNQIIRRLFRDKKEISINSAILFLILGNAAWIIGEVTLQLIDILRDPDASAAEFANLRSIAYIVNLSIYILAAYSLYIAYEHTPKGEEGRRNIFQLRDGPLAPFILGNIAWVVGEIFQIFFGARSETSTNRYFELRYYPRLITLGITLSFFVVAAVRTYRLIDIRQHKEDDRGSDIHDTD
ncbi:MAG TPA: hypothetical protein VF297_06310 [Pyrinomonadaceae bacterium]